MQRMSGPDSKLEHTRIIIPVRNGGARWREAAAALQRAVPDPSIVAVVDSSSSDGSDQVAAQCHFELERIDPRTFNHGRTRQEAVNRFCEGRSYVVFLTHDAVIEGPQSLADLLEAFTDPGVGAAYGRQLPHHNAGPFGRHSAGYLYPARSVTRTLADARQYGIRTAIISNSFAAYRLQALRGCGGFPSALILGEDAYVALRMLQAGWAIAYRADATVRHSHDYSVIQEMQRYFDYGVLHAQLPELLGDEGPPEDEGMRYLKSELRFMAHEAPLRLPELVVRSAAKYLGYRLGRGFQHLPHSMCRRLSMTRGFWDAAPVDRGR
jgi:glycosyl transferase family 2